MLSEADVDAGEVVNVAIISGTSPSGDTVTDEVSAKVTLGGLAITGASILTASGIALALLVLGIFLMRARGRKGNSMKYQRSIAGAAILVASLALAACGSVDDEGAEAGLDAKGNPKVIEVSDQPDCVEDYGGAMDNAEVETCDAGSGGLEVAGTVTNPESDTQDYRIFVSAMTEDDTVGLVQVEVANVAGGESAEWETEMDLAQEDLDCVLRVERFSAE